MESAIKLKDLNVLLEAARQLDSLLKESPEIAALAAAVKESREPVLVMPQDRLILAHEAAKILSVNQSMISGDESLEIRLYALAGKDWSGAAGGYFRFGAGSLRYHSGTGSGR